MSNLDLTVKKRVLSITARIFRSEICFLRPTAGAEIDIYSKMIQEEVIL
ncbi:MAG: hypothetical protein PUC37_02395 [Spirochaetales bacterium]|nr:hypothetical protein [Spirochaetales bacterium]